jgi:copper homeostasis protein
MIKVEVCVDSVQSGIDASESGADRLEVSSCLEIGGITPSYGLVKEITNKIDIPVMVLIRPRSGDFTYTKSEKNVMLESMRSFTNLNIKGFVVGALDDKGNLDESFLAGIMDEFGNYPITFHRAFDYVNDPYKTLKQLIQLKIKRVLTSGQRDDIIKGKDMLKKLQKQARDGFIVMPGGGITPENVYDLVSYTKVKEIHTSSSSLVNIDINYVKRDLKMGKMKERKVFDKARFNLIKEQLRRVKSSE